MGVLVESRFPRAGVYDARNPRADAFLNCFLLLPRRWVFQFAGFIVMCLRALLSF